MSARRILRIIAAIFAQRSRTSPRFCRGFQVTEYFSREVAKVAPCVQCLRRRCEGFPGAISGTANSASSTANGTGDCVVVFSRSLVKFLDTPRSFLLAHCLP